MHQGNLKGRTERGISSPMISASWATSTNTTRRVYAENPVWLIRKDYKRVAEVPLRAGLCACRQRRRRIRRCPFGAPPRAGPPAPPVGGAYFRYGRERRNFRMRGLLTYLFEVHRTLRDGRRGPS